MPALTRMKMDMVTFNLYGAMKNIKFIFALAAAAAFAGACQMEENAPVVSQEKITMTVTASADAETKTVYDAETGKVSWDAAGEYLQVFETAGGATSSVKSSEAAVADGKASFAVALDPKEDGDFVYNAVYPASAWTAGTDVTAMNMTLPAVQNPTAGSFGGNADLLIAKQITATEQPASLSMQFKRITAIGKVTLKNFTTEEPVTSVRFTAAGKSVSGTLTANLTDGTVTYGNGNDYVEVQYAGEEVKTGSIFYFTCFPFELAEGETFTVTAKTATRTYTREVAAPAGGLAFKAGRISSFSVNMASATVAMGEVTAVKLNGSTNVSKTVEDANIYAWKGDLASTELAINATIGGSDYVLVPVAGASVNVKGEPIALKVSSDATKSFDLPAAGYHRVVVNVANMTVKVYDTENDLQPKVIEWYPNGNTSLTKQTTTVTNVFLRGEPAGWNTSGKNIGFSQSAADPQILYHHGQWGYGGRTSFAIFREGTIDGTAYTINNSYVFTCPFKADGTQQDVTLTHGEWHTLIGGAGQERGNYWDIPKVDGNTPNFFVLDLRNMQIYVEVRPK